jgi:hypothetical protein
MSRVELLGRLGRYPGQSSVRTAGFGAEQETEEQRQDRLQSGDPEGIFDTTTAADILNESATEDGAELGINAMIQARNERAQATVADAQRTPAQRLGREVALAIESRVSELEAEQEDDVLANAYEATSAERAALETWLEDDGDEDGETWYADEDEDDEDEAA